MLNGLSLPSPSAQISISSFCGLHCSTSWNSFELFSATFILNTNSPWSKSFSPASTKSGARARSRSFRFASSPLDSATDVFDQVTRLVVLSNDFSSGTVDTKFDLQSLSLFVTFPSIEEMAFDSLFFTRFLQDSPTISRSTSFEQL